MHKVKNNYHYLLLFGFFIFMLAFHQFLFLLNTDDRIYSVIAHASLSDIIYFMKYHYHYCNGRTFIHLVHLFILKFDVFLWRIVNPIVLSLTAFLTAKLMSDKHSFKKALLFSVIAMFSVGAGIMGKSVFWVTGSSNYLLPAALLLTLFCIVKYKKAEWLIPILSLLCGATTEQYGFITVSLFALLIIKQKIFDKQKISAVYILSFFTSLAGFLTIALSPSVFERTYGSINALNNLSMITFTIWFKNKNMIPFVAFLVLTVSLSLIYFAKNKFEKLIAAFLVLAVICSYIISFLDLPVISGLAIWGFALSFILSIAIVSIKYYMAEKNFLPLISVFMGGGAQFMMAFSPRYSERTAVPSVFCFICFAVALLNHIFVKKDKIYNIIKCVVISSFILISLYNINGYIEFAQIQAIEKGTGKYSAVFSNEHSSRDDVDEIINEIHQTLIQEKAKRAK